MSAEVEVVSQVPAVREMPARRSSVLLMPVMDVNTAMVRLREFQSFCDAYLEEGIDGDYGVIPGTKKKTLLKPGADKLCEVYGLYDEYEMISTVEDWDKGLFDYTLTCRLRSRTDDSIAGSGVGSCSSFESKYRWRDSQRKCPTCGAEAIIKGKAEFDGGWLCWGKKGGCGAKFKDKDPLIEQQVIGRVENPDIVDTKNTVLKMAKKRAKIDAVIGVTRSSGIFTQDFGEDTPATVIQPEVATESKTYTRPPAAQDSGGTNNKEASPAFSSEGKPSATDGPKRADHTPPEQPSFCTREQQDWLRLKFKEELPMDMQAKADDYRREFLKSEGFFDAKGQGTSKAIPAAKFKSVAAKCLNHAKTLAKI